MVVLTIIAVSADSELKRLLGNMINIMTVYFRIQSFHQLYSVVLKNKALLYLTSVFSYNLNFTAGAARPCKILNFSRLLQVAATLLTSLSCSKSVKIRLVAT